MIEMKNITKYYDNFRALNNISLEVEAGEVLGLLGPNGAGKTTAMRILTCFLPATSGQAKVAGFDIFEDSIEVRRRLGYLPETPPLYHEMTVSSYLSFIADIKELPSRIKNKKIQEVIERIGLKDNFHRIIGTLSKGYRQRVGLAQALLHDPEVLILDEPTVGLDPNQIIEIRELIKNLSSDHTIILSTHILSEVRMTCSKVVIINEGEIVAEDSVENLERKASGESSWKIKLKSKDEKWRQTFDNFSGAIITSLEPMGDEFAFSLSMKDENRFDELFSEAVKSGIIFREITPVKATLEDVFLKLTGREEKKEAA